MIYFKGEREKQKNDISVEVFFDEFVFLLMYTRGRGKVGPLAALQAARCMYVPV